MKRSTTQSKFATADEIHRYLAAFNAVRFTPTLPSENWRRDIAAFADGALIEGEFLEKERAAVRLLAATAPTDPDGFLEWFERLQEIGPGQNDCLFPWLARSASLAEMKWKTRIGAELLGRDGSREAEGHAWTAA